MKVLFKPYLVILAVLILASIIHTAITRHYSDYLSLTKYLLPLFAVGFMKGYECEVYTDDEGKTQRYYPTAGEACLNGILTMLLVSALAVILLSIYSIITDCIRWVSKPTFNDYQLSIMASVSVMFIAYALFLFRTYLRTAYGLTEIIVGLVIAVDRAITIAHANEINLTVVLAILTAGVYLIVRGLDNMNEGTKAKGDSNVVQNLKSEIEAIKNNLLKKDA